MSGRASSPVLVGRDEQLTALAAALSSVRQGGPAAVLLGGEAGVGKSRLVTEFAQGADAQVLIGGCLELGTDGLPFAPFTAVLRDLVHEMGAEAVASMLPSRTTQGLARLLPELGDPDTEPSTGGDPGEARARLFEEVLSALDHLARNSPVVLVIEDAHWADRSSRDLLTFLIGNQRAIRGLLIIVTFRSDELHRTHPLRPMLAALDRIDWVERIELPRLTRDDTAELAGRILGRGPSADLADALYRRTEGNPLFAETLLCCDGELRELPESLRDLLLDSVRRLPADTQDVLRAASAGGQATGHALLAAVTGLEDVALISALRPAVTANVLKTAADGYAFRHELIREAVHDDLLPGEHGRLHGRFAEAIDADPTLVPPGRAAIEMAHHWHSAHDPVWALIGAWRAAAQAGRAVAPAERLSLLSRVLELWDQVPNAAERIGADHARVLAEAVGAALDAGEYERSVALADSALRELDPVTDPVRVAQLLDDRGRGKMLLGRKEFPRDFAEALRLAPADAPAVRISILLNAARCMPRIPGEASYAETEVSYAEEALALARQTGDLANEANALLTLAMFRAGAGQAGGVGSDPMDLIAQARAMAERAGALHLLVKAAANESHLLEGAGEHELAAAAARRGTAGGDVACLSLAWRGVLAINQVEPLFALGRWDEAIGVADAARDVMLLPMDRCALQILRGRIALARGEVGAAADAAATAAGLLRGRPYEDERRLPLGVLEILLAATTGAGAAVQSAARVIGDYELSGGSPRYAWPMVVAAADACLTAVRNGTVAGETAPGDAAPGDAAPGEASALAGRLRTIAEKLEAFGPAQHASRLTFAAALACLESGPSGASDDGGLAWDEAAAAWDEAAAAWEAVSEPYPRAQALLHAAEAALAGGDRDRAAGRLRQALEGATSLGATPLADGIARMARRAGLDRGAPARFGLTGRELEVLRLVAAGRSNRDIAAELFISPKTASVHVSNILGKLGVASRGEAAAKARTVLTEALYPFRGGPGRPRGGWGHNAGVAERLRQGAAVMRTVRRAIASVGAPGGGPRLMNGWLVGVLVLASLAATTVRADAAPAPWGPDVKACGSLASFPSGTANEIMSGKLTIAPFPAVTIDPNRDGNINWSQDPFNDPTWVVDFQDGQWIEALVEAYLAGGPNADAYRARAKALLTGWMSQVPPVNQQPYTAICSAEAFPGQAWIHDEIPVVLNYQASHWEGAYNHGLKQDLQLLGAGCAYPASEWGGAPVRWRDTARQQMIDSFEPNQYGPVLDSQGVTNEQSTGYDNFNMGLWDTAEHDLAVCGLSFPGWMSSRIALMPNFLAMATQPNGDLVQIGDTYVIRPRNRPGTPLQYAYSMGKAGQMPTQKVAVYQAGYVLGRSGWGTAKTFGEQSFYSLRFGPGTQIHGHDDHMGLTYYANGRNLIVDAGHYGYAETPYRAYLVSPEAASDLVMPGVPFDSSASTALIHQDIGADGQFFEFYDTAFDGRPRYRSVYVDQDPNLVLVFDRASGAASYEQLWHLDPGLTVTKVGRSYAIADAPGTQLELLQIALPGQQIPAGSTQVIRGQTNPYQGWVSHAQRQMTPAPVVTMTRTGSSAAILTLIVPTAPGTSISTSISQHSSGVYQLQVDIGGRSLSFLVSADGDIQAG